MVINWLFMLACKATIWCFQLTLIMLLLYNLPFCNTHQWYHVSQPPIISTCDVRQCATLHSAAWSDISSAVWLSDPTEPDPARRHASLSEEHEGVALTSHKFIKIQSHIVTPIRVFEVWILVPMNLIQHHLSVNSDARCCVISYNNGVWHDVGQADLLYWWHLHVDGLQPPCVRNPSRYTLKDGQASLIWQLWWVLESRYERLRYIAVNKYMRYAIRISWNR
jgi:hypothetical protein